jgi:hypothetical protein
MATEKKDKKYVQFSKRMVVLSLLSGEIFSAFAMWLCYASNYPEGIVSIATANMIVSMIVFIAYSGNSALEKWLIKHAGGTLGSELQGAFTKVSVSETTYKEEN